MTALKPKYAQVSDGYWQSPTAVQVGFTLDCRPAELKCYSEDVWRPPCFCCPQTCLYSVKECSKTHMHRGAAVCVQLSGFQHKEQYMKGGHALDAFFWLWHMSFVLTQWVVTFYMYVCFRETGLLPRPYHDNPFCLISIRQASVREIKQTLQATGFVFDPVTQTWYIKRRWGFGLFSNQTSRVACEKPSSLCDAKHTHLKKTYFCCIEHTYYTEFCPSLREQRHLWPWCDKMSFCFRTLKIRSHKEDNTVLFEKDLMTCSFSFYFNCSVRLRTHYICTLRYMYWNNKRTKTYNTHIPGMFM